MQTTLQNKPQNNYKPIKNLLSKGSTNSKTVKNDLETFILYLAPSKIVDGFNLCTKGCLYSAGRGRFSNVQLSRINKTKFWAYDRSNFYIQLANEILSIQDKTIKNGNKIAIRLNGTSDVDHLYLLERYSGINFLDPFYSNLLFYDYTKNPNIISRYKNTNYKVTFSRSESNEIEAKRILKLGGNVAIVFQDQLPKKWNGYKVINGDDTDLRYFDPVNVVVGLKAKGDAKKDLTGFVVR